MTPPAPEALTPLPPVATGLAKQGETISGQAAAVEITTADSYRQAGALLRAIKAGEKQVDEIFDPIVRAAHAAHRIAVAQKKLVRDPFEEAERDVKAKMDAWDEAERARAKAAARDAAILAQRASEEAQMRGALALEAEGKPEAAAAVLAGPPPIVFTPSAVRPPVRVEGISTREAWAAEVENLWALIQAVAAGAQPVEALLPNQQFLDAQARALKGHLAIPGVKAVSRTVRSVSA